MRILDQQHIANNANGILGQLLVPGAYTVTRINDKQGTLLRVRHIICFCKILPI